jgi:hypothetical protein
MVQSCRERRARIKASKAEVGQQPPEAIWGRRSTRPYFTFLEAPLLCIV